VAANLSAQELRKNRRPDLAVRMHAGTFLEELAAAAPGAGRPALASWFETLRGREAQRDGEIVKQGAARGELVNPLAFFLRLEEKMADDAVLVVDGGDFVARRRTCCGPARRSRGSIPGVRHAGRGRRLRHRRVAVPSRQRGLADLRRRLERLHAREFDTYVRHGLAPIAVIGNDGAWAQIAREQVDMLGDDIGTVLNRCDYHLVAEGYGGVGLRLDDPAKIDETIDRAKALSRAGKPVCINVHLARSDFRKARCQCDPGATGSETVNVLPAPARSRR